MRKQLADKSQLEKIVHGYELEIQQLKAEGNQFEKIARENLEKKIGQLQAENMHLLRTQTESVDVNKAVGTGLRYNLEVAKERISKLQGLFLRAMMRTNALLS